MQRVLLAKILSEFQSAISSDQNDVVLDPSIERLKRKITEPSFLEPFSIYSRAQLRKLAEVLGGISNAQLKENPLQVALAVDTALQLFGELEGTVRQSLESKMRIEARRSA